MGELSIEKKMVMENVADGFYQNDLQMTFK